jgi:hypothetical protein
MPTIHAFGAGLAAGFALWAGAARAAQPTLCEPPAVTQAISEASQRFTVPEDWIRAVIRVESGGKSKAVSPKGAMGLMQIMPATWRPLRLRYGLGADPYDIHDNIVAGTGLLRELYDRFGTNGFLAAYNAGPSRYLSFLDSGEPLTEETRAYLAKLAPLLKGQLAAAVVAPAGSHDWRAAPLFLTAWPAGSGLALEASSSSISAAATALPIATPARLAPGDGGLFVTLLVKVSP